LLVTCLFFIYVTYVVKVEWLPLLDTLRTNKFNLTDVALVANSFLSRQ